MPGRRYEQSAGMTVNDTTKDAAIDTIVATPIGNLGDMPPRGLAVLAAADAVLCEDTRVTARLLARNGISRPLVAYHEHNESAMTPRVVAWLAAGKRVALASDAGMPLVSDPGYRLVAAASEAPS